MLDSRSNSNAALSSILKMCKDCDASNVSMIRTLILKALSSPDIFCGFDELKLAVRPTLASTGPPDAEALLQTLDLFSYGTYKDYMSSSSAATGGGTFLTLTDAQLHKLQMLTVLTLVEDACFSSTSNGVLSYSVVAQELSLMPVDSPDSFRQVEEVIIACIYAGLIRGKLCQKTQSLVCSSQDGPPCRPRDVRQVSSMLQSLRSLQRNLISTAMSMDADKTHVEQRREAHVNNMNRIKQTTAGKTRAMNNNNLLRGQQQWDGDSAAGGMSSLGSVGGGSAEQAMEAARAAASSSSSNVARRQGKRSRGGGPSGLMGDSSYPRT